MFAKNPEEGGMGRGRLMGTEVQWKTKIVSKLLQHRITGFVTVNQVLHVPNVREQHASGAGYTRARVDCYKLHTY